MSIFIIDKSRTSLSILLDDDTSVTGYYLKDALLASGTSLRAVSTGEKLVLGTNNKLKVHLLLLVLFLVESLS